MSTSQEALDFGRLYRITDGSRAMYRSLADAVDSVGVLTAAGACGIDRGDLRRSLDRDGRRVAVEHAMSIAALCGYDQRKTIASAFVAPLGFTLADDVPPMTDAEKAARLEAALVALGPIGEQAARLALGRR